MDAIELAVAHLADPANSWSIGASGVLAEFARDPGEACQFDGRCVVTGRGAIRVEPRAGLEALAYEVLSAQPGPWHHGVLFTLPARDAALQARSVVTEVRPDREAIRAEDRAALLFDLGLGSDCFTFCVRTAEPALIATLRRAVGSGLTAAGHALASALVVASPHRIAISRVARIEVYQPIAPEGAATPSGPHTHLIPRLLRAFQRLLAEFGDPVSVAAKTAVLATVERGDPPGGWRAPATRYARQACRIGLRQLRQSGAALPALAAWEGAIDRSLAG